MEIFRHRIDLNETETVNVYEHFLGINSVYDQRVNEHIQTAMSIQLIVIGLSLMILIILFKAALN